MEESRRLHVCWCGLWRYFVVLSVEPVERSRVCVSCWYGEINRS